MDLLLKLFVKGWELDLSKMGIDIGWTILFTHSISKMYPLYTQLLRNVVKSYWVAHIFHFLYVTSWIRVHSIPTIIDISTFNWFNFTLRVPLISILQKNKCTFAIPVATTFANIFIYLRIVGIEPTINLYQRFAFPLG